MLQILYEDESVIVVWKPAGVESQSARGLKMDMVSMIKRHIHNLSSEKGEPYVGVIHRLDKPVSGILVYAKDRKSAASLISGAKRAELTCKALQNIDREPYGCLTLAEITLLTGRHHQIRVQMAGHGLPLLGDRKYKPDFAAAKREGEKLALSACWLSFGHPVTGKRMSFHQMPEWEVLTEFEAVESSYCG